MLIKQKYLEYRKKKKTTITENSIYSVSKKYGVSQN